MIYIQGVFHSRRSNLPLASSFRYALVAGLSLIAVSCKADVNDALLAVFPPSTQAPINPAGLTTNGNGFGFFRGSGMVRRRVRVGRRLAIGSSGENSDT